MAKISVDLGIQVKDGPVMKAARTIEADAYDKLDVPLAPGAEKTYEIQPSGAAGAVKLLLVQSSFYSGKKDADGKEITGTITYSIGAVVKDQVLDQPLLFLGSGVLSALGPPQKISFKDTYPAVKKAAQGSEEKDVDLTEVNTAYLSILVGRDATATPPPPPTPGA